MAGRDGRETEGGEDADQEWGSRDEIIGRSGDSQRKKGREDQGAEKENRGGDGNGAVQSNGKMGEDEMNVSGKR